MGKANLPGKEEGVREEAQHQGAQGNFSHPWATTKNARPAGVVGRQWIGDKEWWGYRMGVWTPACFACAVRGKCSQENWGSGTAPLRCWRLHSPPWETGSTRSGSSGRPWAACYGSPMMARMGDFMESVCYPWEQDTLGIAGPLDDVPLEDLKQRFTTVIKAQPRLVLPMQSRLPTCSASSITPWDNIGRTDSRRRRTRS